MCAWVRDLRGCVGVRNCGLARGEGRAYVGEGRAWVHVCVARGVCAWDEGEGRWG